MPLDAKQAQAATSFGSSLAVIAGAGSGKTQTMKERVVDAFAARTSEERIEGGGVLSTHGRVVDHIGEVLAITYTEAAASELKERIKAALRASDDETVRAQALLVDDAWISTIHGMCGRLLRENAFSLGVDPNFTMVPETEASALLAKAIDDALAASPAAELLVREYGGADRSGVHSMVEDLVRAVVKSPDLFDSFVLPPAGSPEDALRSLRSALANDPAEDLRIAKEEGVAEGLSRAGMATEGDAEAISAIDALLERGGATAEDAYAVCSLIKLKGNDPDPAAAIPLRGWDSPWSEIGPTNRRSAVSLCVLSLRLMAMDARLEDLVAIARDAYRRFCQAKRKRALMDFDDLLLYAYHALRDEGIQALYRDKFKLVIVDEFQDTNQLQLDIIRNFAGPNDSRLCVVGDRMQSIYRFQGADVSVCNNHLATSVRETLSIDNNYRSHEQIIRFVDTVFAGLGFDYLPLTAARTEKPSGTPGAFDELREGARTSVLEVQQFSQAHVSVPARLLAATHIARRFKRMHDAPGPDAGVGAEPAGGRPYSDMVILLSAMTNANVYADALRAEGIPCAIVKGSAMKSAPEAALVVDVLRCLADAQDTQALFDVLEGPLFELADRDFAALAVATPKERVAQDDPQRVYRDLARRFDRYVALKQSGRETEPALEGLSERAMCAVCAIGEARCVLGTAPVHVALNHVVTASGFFARLKDGDARTFGQRQAQAANVLKMVRLVKDMEQQGAQGANALAGLLADHVENTGETPGSLALEEGDFVRIMTIHASKGLSFPVVALGELRRSSFSSKLLVESSRGKTYVVLDSGATAGTDKSCASLGAGKLTFGLVDAQGDFDADDLAASAAAADHYGAPGILYAAVSAFHKAQEEEELQRKIYVGMTRPEEALIVTFVNDVPVGEVDAAFAEDALSAAVEASGLEAKAARPFINANGLRGMVSGSLGNLHDRSADVVSAGGEYLAVTPMWLDAWTRTGVLPVALREGGERAQDADGFDLRTVAPASDAAGSLPAVEPPFTVYSDAKLRIPRQFALTGGWSSGVVSASSIKAASDSLALEQPQTPLDVFADEGDIVEDTQPARDSTARGLAFHALAQWAVGARKPGEALAVPPVDRIAAVCAFNGLAEDDRADVERMLTAWVASPLAHEAAACTLLRAEVPFFCTLSDTEDAPVDINGFIDLLGTEGAGSAGEALVVDYKTGTSLTTPEERHAAYAVQAQAYAYALLRQGFDAVSARFVFVEQDEGGTLPVEEFPAAGERYTSADELREELCARLDGISLAE